MAETDTYLERFNAALASATSPEDAHAKCLKVMQDSEIESIKYHTSIPAERAATDCVDINGRLIALNFSNKSNYDMVANIANGFLKECVSRWP